MQARERNLGRWDQPEIISVDPIGISRKLRQLSRAPHRRAAHKKWWEYLLIPVLVYMEIQHQGDQRPLQADCAPDIEGEA